MLSCTYFKTRNDDAMNFMVNSTYVYCLCDKCNLEIKGSLISRSLKTISQFTFDTKKNYQSKTSSIKTTLNTI